MRTQARRRGGGKDLFGSKAHWAKLKKSLSSVSRLTLTKPKEGYEGLDAIDEDGDDAGDEEEDDEDEDHEADAVDKDMTQDKEANEEADEDDGSVTNPLLGSRTKPKSSSKTKPKPSADKGKDAIASAPDGSQELNSSDTTERESSDSAGNGSDDGKGTAAGGTAVASVAPAGGGVAAAIAAARAGAAQQRRGSVARLASGAAKLLGAGGGGRVGGASGGGRRRESMAGLGLDDGGSALGVGQGGGNDGQLIQIDTGDFMVENDARLLFNVISSIQRREAKAAGENLPAGQLVYKRLWIDLRPFVPRIPVDVVRKAVYHQTLDETMLNVHMLQFQMQSQQARLRELISEQQQDMLLKVRELKHEQQAIAAEVLAEEQLDMATGYSEYPKAQQMGRPVEIDDKVEVVREQMRAKLADVQERFESMERQNTAMLDNLGQSLTKAKAASAASVEAGLGMGMGMGIGGVPGMGNMAANAAAMAAATAGGGSGVAAQEALSAATASPVAGAAAPAGAGGADHGRKVNLNREGYLMMKVTGEKSASSFFGAAAAPKWEKLLIKLRAASSQIVYYEGDGGAGGMRGQASLTKKGNIWLKDAKEFIADPPPDTKNLREHTFHLPMRKDDARVFMFAADDEQDKQGWVDSIDAVFKKATKHRRK